MRKLIYGIFAAALCCCVISCNEKPGHYRFVQEKADGSQIEEKIEALNDTDAVKQYLERLTAIIIEKMTSGADSVESDIKGMYIISPKGDTLNTNDELMNAIGEEIMKSQEGPAQTMRIPVKAQAAPASAEAQAVPVEAKK